MPNNKIHEGRNVKRFREMLGIKQEALAQDLGDDWSQKKVSQLEAKESIDPVLLQQVASVLKLPIETFQNFDDEQAIHVIANTFNCTDFKDNSAVVNIKPVFDPVDTILKLHEEKIDLYERMLKEKDEMMARLEKLIEKK